MKKLFGRAKNDAAYWRKELAGNTVLNADGQSLGDSGARALAEALKGNSTLTTLDVHNNSIGEGGARALAEALKGNRTLTTLYLGSNSIGVEGARALAEALKGNRTLTTLYLYSNSISDGDARALAEALKGNEALTTLSLGSNSIGDGGARALAEALKGNRTLTTLYLDNNSIGVEGAHALAEALAHNSTLSKLDLSRNNVLENLRSEVETAARNPAARREQLKKRQEAEAAERARVQREDEARRQEAERERQRREAEERSLLALRVAFFSACRDGELTKVVAALADPSLDPNVCDPEDRTGFMLACDAGHLACVELLLGDPRVDADAADAQGDTGFILACRARRAEVVSALLRRADRVDVMRRNKAGETGVDVARALREAEAEAARVAEEERRRAEEERLKKEAEVAAFARALAELGLHADDRDGGPVEVPPQALAAPVGGAAGRADSAFEPSTNPPLGRVPDAPAPSPAPAPPPPVERPSATSSYEIDPKHLQQGGFLGRGGFGMVMEGTYQKHTKVALKMINGIDAADLEGGGVIAEFDKEMEVWGRLPPHVNVLPLMGWCRKPLCLVTLLMAGTAKDYLRKLKPTPWEIRAVHRLLFQVALGMNHLHSLPTPILHLDLKGENVLVDENGVAKISDFGLAKIRTTASLRSTISGGGTPVFMAPESFRKPRPTPGTATDVYAFGMTMWELLSEGKTPLMQELLDEGMIIPGHGIDFEEFKPRIRSDPDFRPERPRGIPDATWALMQRCWAMDAAARPGFGEVADEMKRILDAL